LRVAFGIVRLFPEGGLQRDCVRLGRLLLKRGHQVAIFATESRFELPEGLAVTLLPVHAFTNHGRDWGFAGKFAAAVAGGADPSSSIGHPSSDRFALIISQQAGGKC